MLRKVTLATASSVMLLGVLVAAPSAFAYDPNNFCTDNGLAPGIYNDAAQVRKFDLAVDPTTQFADAQVTGGANLCGTVAPDGPFYRNGVVTTPGREEQIHCANPANAGAYCAGQAEADLPDGSYVGDAASDVWCDSSICELFNIEENEDVATKTYIDYDTSSHGGSNRCTSDAVSCAETRASILGEECDSDIIIKQSGDAFTLTINQPDCESGASPSYFYNVDELLLCKYAGAVGGQSCGTDPALWQQRNGKARVRDGVVKKVTYKLVATMTNGQTFNAKAKVKWTL